MSNQREEEILRRRERIKKSKERRRRNQSRKTGEKKSRRKLIAAGVSIALITAAGGAGYTVVMGNAQKKAEVWSYEKEHYGEMSYFPRDLRLPISVFLRMIKMRSAMTVRQTSMLRDFLMWMGRVFDILIGFTIVSTRQARQRSSRR